MVNTPIENIMKLADRIREEAVKLDVKKVRTLKLRARRPHQNSNGDRAHALKLQGRYMGLIRTLSVRKKKLYREIRVEKGINAAIRAILRDRE